MINLSYSIYLSIPEWRGTFDTDNVTDLYLIDEMNSLFMISYQFFIL